MGAGFCPYLCRKHSSSKNSRDPECLNTDRWKTLLPNKDQQENKICSVNKKKFKKIYLCIFIFISIQSWFWSQTLAQSLFNSKPVLKRKTQSFCLISGAMIWDRKRKEFRKLLYFSLYLLLSLLYLSLNIYVCICLYK